MPRTRHDSGPRRQQCRRQGQPYRAAALQVQDADVGDRRTTGRGQLEAPDHATRRPRPAARHRQRRRRRPVRPGGGALPEIPRRHDAPGRRFSGGRSRLSHGPLPARLPAAGSRQPVAARPDRGRPRGGRNRGGDRHAARAPAPRRADGLGARGARSGLRGLARDPRPRSDRSAGVTHFRHHVFPQRPDARDPGAGRPGRPRLAQGPARLRLLPVRLGLRA